MRRKLLSGLSAIPLLALALACQAAPPPVAKPAGTAAPTQVLRSDQALATPVTTGKVESAAPVDTRSEAKGRVVYAWHVAISPTYLDPQENAAVITPYGFGYAIHDALVKHMPGKPFAPSLAESYEVAPD